MIQGKYLIYKHIAHTLIDPGATHSFVSHTFAQHLSVIPVFLDFALVVYTPENGNMAFRIVYKSCIIKAADKEFEASILVERYEKRHC